MDKAIIKQIILEQREIFDKEQKIVERGEYSNVLKNPKIVIITGIRRCGKSTLMRLLARNYKAYSYVNFEDERFLDFTYGDFNSLLECFLELSPDCKTFFFDEIQNIAGWEKFVRRLFSEDYKLFVTGSNARLLSSEISTALTGRNLKIELYPFNFKEYLLFHGFQLKPDYTTKERALLSNYFKDYIGYGGFPEIVKSHDFEELNGIYQDIIIKDILVRLKIRDAKDFRELALYLLSNVAKKASYNNLKGLLGFSSTSKVKGYVEALSEAYLFFAVSKYDRSVKKQVVNDKKVYAIDTGIVNAVSFQFSENSGRLLENAVFIELKRRHKDIYYFQGKQECDFLIKEGIKITQCIQVAESVSSIETKKREVGGLLEAMKNFNVKEGLILTRDASDEFKTEGRKIKVMPLWQWLIS